MSKIKADNGTSSITAVKFPLIRDCNHSLVSGAESFQMGRVEKEIIDVEL